MFIDFSKLRDWRVSGLARNHERKKRVRKQIPADLEVTVANNTDGMFEYQSPNKVLTLSMEKYGDEEFVNFEDLRQLKRYLEDFSLVIVDVNSDEYSVIDIARSLRVNRSYEEYFKSILGLSDEEMEEEYDIDLEELDDFIKDSTLEEYKVQLEGRIKKTIIERSVALYREGELNDYSKLQALKATRPVDERETFLDYVKG